jgi:murein tripeptide amidase MpaA
MCNENLERPIHLLAISSAEVEKNRTEDYIEHLFPNRDKESHLKYTDKPVILITSRVHPGEVGASHALNGMLEFLTGNDDVAIRLRNDYMFLVVPMLNPDGVYNGNNRMDSLGQNLNRFYHLPDV